MATVVQQLKVLIGADNKKFLSGIQQSQKQLSGFTKNVTGFAKIAGAAFAGISIGQFGAEILKLTGQLKGIKIGFDALNQPGLLDKLRAATKGTVSDLELMRQSVRASNFQIPIEKLAGAFEFARKRAAATGEEVDYLVSSIIDGIGRKSSLVLDNLGISASQLQEEMKKTGDFATAAFNLIEEGARNMPAALDEAVSSTERLATAWQNFKVTLADSKFFNDVEKFATDLLNLGSGQTSFREFLEAQSLAVPTVTNQKRFGGTTDPQTALDEILGNIPGASFGAVEPEVIEKAIKIKPESLQRLKEVDKIIGRFAAISSRTNKSGQTFGLGTTENILESNINVGEAALDRLDKTIPKAKTEAENLNVSLLDTLDIVPTLTNSFQDLFNTILSGGASAEAIFKRLLATLAGKFIGTILGGPGGGIVLGGALEQLGSVSSSIPLARVTGDQLTFIQSRTSTKQGRIGN